MPQAAAALAWSSLLLIFWSFGLRAFMKAP